ILAEAGQAAAIPDAAAGVASLTALAAKSLELAAGRVEGASSSVCGSAPQGALDIDGKIVVVTEDGCTLEEIAAAAAGVSRLALPLPRAAFRYMVRCYDPYAYAPLARQRKVVSGADPFQGIASPEPSAFAAYLESRLDHLLAFTRGPELFPSGAFDPRDLQNELRRLMGLRLLRERGCLILVRAEIDAAWRREFP